ncbi:MAG TPA: 16S rRNA (guanine(527)-N(7))-methyltransferase RsmG [Geminicoccus sp.]|jgi:16S rRNA (guanine527-N7)-methyltransferase|uniref:16S rRNA (guanine(527)-N(7))-methyltransferase RsmG n=1 Tax=Geminicoccus sp. TaxID=2024832 RepID=UPI002E358490|nr:16S rRNA (guanine(527)-N(7))-methyltransferase RsmG [Geminicoccus sp.]HEX2528322.1 16S rRNA (guanine(527)-N(7))-methyltransferase RsmG [Geminicoccus sp.]
MNQDRPLSPEDCAALLDVSRETLARLEQWVELLAMWQQRINLVSATTLRDPWRRHVLDGGQLLRHAPAAAIWADLGTGPGVPGMILAIMGVPQVHLVESDQRKVAFLRESARVTATKVTIHARRIEQADMPPADVVTARALAPLDKLLGLAKPHMGPATVGLFPKGEGLPAELTEAARHWHMKPDVLPSLSDPRGNILRVCEVARVDGRRVQERS